MMCWVRDDLSNGNSSPPSPSATHIPNPRKMVNTEDTVSTCIMRRKGKGLGGREHGREIEGGA